MIFILAWALSMLVCTAVCILFSQYYVHKEVKTITEETVNALGIKLESAIGFKYISMEEENGTD